MSPITNEKFRLLPIPEGKGPKSYQYGRWRGIFAQIPPGMAAVMELTPVDVLKCRTSLYNAQRNGRFTDLYTFTQGDELWVARKPNGKPIEEA